MSAVTEDLEFIIVEVEDHRLELYALVCLPIALVQLYNNGRKNIADATCEDGTVHLVGGDDVSRGRVEYCYEGTWYTVCASDWEDNGEEARVICSTLGYSYYCKNNKYNNECFIKISF